MTHESRKVRVPQFFSNALIPRTIGFDDVFNALESVAARASDAVDNFPPYDIVKLSDTEWDIRMAVAGYSKDQIRIEMENNVLTVSAETSSENSSDENQKVFLYKGISTKKFTRRWTVTDSTKVRVAKFVDGILTISLIKIPVERKATQIEIL